MEDGFDMEKWRLRIEGPAQNQGTAEQELGKPVGYTCKSADACWEVIF